MTDIINVDEWRKRLDKFVEERNWREFHNPKNLAMNLCGEAAELMEIYTWHNNEKSKTLHLDPEINTNIRHEIGDVLMTVIMLAEELDINLAEALEEKLSVTEIKYPAQPPEY